MPSPFPGMDPFLEQPAIWADLHLTLLIAMRAELNAHLPAGSIILNLGDCLDRSFDDARYADEFDYTQPPNPRLDGEDARWAEHC